MLSEKQAWQKIAHAFSDMIQNEFKTYHMTKQGWAGMCEGIKQLREKGLILYSVHSTMLGKIKKAMPRKDIAFKYMYPNDLEGAVKRVEFCKERIAELE